MDNHTSAGRPTRCRYCQTENRAGATVCIFCGHALPAAVAQAPASPDYAFAPQPRSPAARMVGKSEFKLASGMPPRVEPTLGAKRAPGPPDVPPRAAPPSRQAPAASAVGAPSAEVPAASTAPSPQMGHADLGQQAPPYFEPAAFGTPTYPPSWYEDQPRSGNRVGSGLLLVCIFALGALSGAAALWWTGNPDGVRRAMASWQSGAQPPAAAALATSAGELPYDGAAPAAAAPVPKPAAAADTASTPIAPNPATLAAAGPSAAAATSPAIPATPAAPDANRLSAAPTAGAANGTVVNAAAIDHAAPKPIPAANAEGKPEPGAGAAKKRSREPALARNDTAGERSLTPLMIAQCESMSSASERSQCKREVCYGKWGKNGCPAEGN